VSAPVRTPPPALPSPCRARPGAASTARPAVQTPRRLRFAGFTGADSPMNIAARFWPSGPRSGCFVTPDSPMVKGAHRYSPVPSDTLFGARDTLKGDGYLSHGLCDAYPFELIVCVFFVPAMYAPKYRSVPLRDTERNTAGDGINTGLPPSVGEANGPRNRPVAVQNQPVFRLRRRRQKARTGEVTMATRSFQRSIRFTNNEWDAVIRAAEKAGLTSGAFVPPSQRVLHRGRGAGRPMVQPQRPLRPCRRRQDRQRGLPPVV